MLKLISKVKISKCDGSEVYKDFPVDRLDFKKNTANIDKDLDDDQIDSEEVKKILD